MFCDLFLCVGWGVRRHYVVVLSGGTDMSAEIHGSEAVAGEGRGRDVWESDRVDAFGWAVGFVWAAIVVLASSTTWHERYDWWDGWGVFFIGAGVIVVAEALIRLMMPEYSWKFGWSLMWGIVFVAFGLSVFYGPAWLALVLVAFAVATLAGALRNPS